MSVSEDPVNVHQQDLDLGSDLVNFLFRKGRVEGHENVGLAEALPQRMAEIISRYSMLSSGDRVGVAVSGGADSVVLLHLLSEISESFPLEIFVLHLNHQLRKEESAADEVFVEALAETLKLPVEIGRVVLPEKGNLEQNARAARRAFFQEARDKRLLRRVALGHTRSDQAETVLFRFLRGSGTAGLAGMRAVSSDGFIRPLLTTSREEVRQWADLKGIVWREDSSNQDLRFRRNRLRRRTIPALARQYNSNLSAVLAGMAEVAQAEEEYWAERSEAIRRQITKRTPLGLFLQVSDITRLHLAEQRRLVRRLLAEVKGDLRSINVEHIHRILDLCRTEQGHNRVLVPGVDALRSFGTLRLSEFPPAVSMERDYKIPVLLGGWQDLPFHAGRIAVHWADCGSLDFLSSEEDQGCERATVGFFPSTATSLYIRSWQPGDQIQLAGQKAPIKLKFLFQEHRVVLWERKHWPVLVWNNEIVWARRFGPSGKFSQIGGGTRALCVAYLPGRNDKEKVVPATSD